jgi:hypothetical protein
MISFSLIIRQWYDDTTLSVMGCILCLAAAFFKDEIISFVIIISVISVSRFRNKKHFEM